MQFPADEIEQCLPIILRMGVSARSQVKSQLLFGADETVHRAGRPGALNHPLRIGPPVVQGVCQEQRTGRDGRHQAVLIERQFVLAVQIWLNLCPG